MDAAKVADIFVIIGTTGLVYPAANLPGDAKTAGATIIEINPESSAYTSRITDIFIQEKLSAVWKNFWRKCWGWSS